MTHNRYDEAMALARRIAAERDERFEQLKTAEAERDRYAKALAKIRDGTWTYADWPRAIAESALAAPITSRGSS